MADNSDNDFSDHGAGANNAQQQPTASAKDPYGVLNVSSHATLDEINNNYRQLSRSFHPDKQPPGLQREEAQTAFVDFKVAHDILTDPVLRQGYDHASHYGVYFLKRSMASQDENSIFHRMVRLHKVGKADEARLVLDEAIQYNEYQVMTSEVDASGSIEIRCNMMHTGFLSEGSEAMGVPEVEKAAVSFSVGTSHDDGKWSASFGGSSSVRNGEASGSGSVSLGYNPVQGTDVSLDIDIGEDAKVSVSTSRVLTSQTLVNASVSTLPGSDHLALSLSSHRPLFKNAVRGTWAIGMTPNPTFSLHYGLLQFTTLNTKPKYTVKLNLGIDNYPLRLSADHKIAAGHFGQLSYGWGTGGVELSATLTRILSKYAKFSIGLKHATIRGLTWLLRFQRGQMTFSIPISVTSITSSGYSFKCLYMTFLSLLIDEAIGDLVFEATAKLIDDSDKESKMALRKEERQLAEMNKARTDAKKQADLMAKPAELKRSVEEEKDGLVILKGTYEVEGGDTLDVTTQLQFWVTNSALHLPPTSKSNLLGFYDVRRILAEEAVTTSFTSRWKQLLSKCSWGLIDLPPNVTNSPIPTLTVRYKYKGGVFETSCFDAEPLSLPSPIALRLGDSRYVE